MMRIGPAGALAGLMILVFSAVLLPKTAGAEGYLAVKPTKLEKLVLGTDTIGFKFSVEEYNLETGKAYSLEIESSGFQEYALEAPQFFNFIWLRKVEAGDVEIKAHSLYELEFEGEGELELFFVPIRPGRYEMYARGLKEKGSVVIFNVK